MRFPRKTFVLGGLVSAAAALIIFQSSAPPPPSDPDFDFTQDPPIAEKYWVKKLAEPNDQYNMLMKIQYLPDDRLEELPVLNIHYADGDESYVAFHDDGEAGDSIAGDFIYSAYIMQDIESFRTGISDLLRSSG
ncbi:MAG TPA: hypothetical protein VL093_02915 [Flavipsychrobacter sp.]|nr:hypothetical protein [Flavipsychrobacter sp.]